MRTDTKRILSPLLIPATIVSLCWHGAPGGEIAVDDATQMSQAVARAQPGDTLILADGLYKDVRLDFKAKGAERRPITLRPQTPGKATITGESVVVISGEYLVVSGFVFDQAWRSGVVSFAGATRCRLTDCAFIESGNPKSTYSHMIGLANHSQHNRVDHCYLLGNLSMGIGVRIGQNDFENTHNRFDHNHFKDIKRRSSNGQEAIQFGQGGLSDRMPQHSLAEFNLFDNASGDAEIISNKSCYNTIRYNTFRNCSAMLVLRGGSHAHVEGNFFINNAGGIRVHDSYHTIVGNYIEGCRRAGIYMPTAAGLGELGYYGPVNYCVVAHNTIVNAGKVGLHIGEPNMQGKELWRVQLCNNTFIGNLIVGNRGVLVRDDGALRSTWRNNIVWATGEADVGYEHQGIKRVDPGMAKKDGLYRPSNKKSAVVDPPSPNFRDVNAPIPGLTTDMDGQKRGSKLDIGADELSDEPPVRRPLTPKDVGPTWMQGDPSKIQRIKSPRPIPKR